ncbi:cold shock domain-containing protein [Actinomadura montaniterrae]|uniref:Cold shock domain-containing protein n=2 Tax=Actinomadura montaniterrae TaxID=1803903 RepID=A0A6L3W1Y4_9ACTN|nr:cold shock domain-containing protein [Actinomadura montaniterrae]
MLLAKDPDRRIPSAQVRRVLDIFASAVPPSPPESRPRPPAQKQAAASAEPLGGAAKADLAQQASVPEPAQTGEYFTGRVKWWNEEKGYGFITPDGPGPDVFAHYSNILMNGFRTLIDGQRVRYTITQMKRGPAAENITPL